MITDLRCAEHDIRKIESLLLGHQIARNYFQGELYDWLGNRFDGVFLELIGKEPVKLDMETSARLFMIPDKSTARILNVNEHGNAPAGKKIYFFNSFVPDGVQNSVIVLRMEKMPNVWCDALYIDTMMLRPDAPAGLCTVAFGLRAVTAWRLGFDHIQVFAAGCGPLRPGDHDAMIGYCIWPKLPAVAITKASNFEVNMMPLSKAQADQLAEYRRASDQLRKKMAATAVPDENEILPVNGVLHMPACKPLTAEQALALFGKSRISNNILREIAEGGARKWHVARASDE